jgi:crotonobetainyl-CoA:carnitine CoA-transferase CaiB-like acyl-CoA transferase
MNGGKTLFAQLMDFLPWSTFTRIVARYGGDQRVRTLSCAEHRAKIEPPGHGDDTRTFGPFYKGQSLYFSFVNRGKESIVLNLKDEADRTIFLNMVRQADILTENFRPGAMGRLGFSYEELFKLNPRLIYASSTGFGQTGPLKTFPP